MTKRCIFLISLLIFYPYITALQDTTPPTSNVEEIIPYWHRTAITVRAYAIDDDSGVANVTLYYRFSSDGTVWGAWKSYGFGQHDIGGWWFWKFLFPEGVGYYEFYSIAVDNAGNVEASPAQADARAGYDNLPPAINAISYPSIQQVNEAVNITCNVIDNLAGVKYARVEMEYPNGSIYNYTMERAGAIYYLNRSYGVTGNYTFRIFAGDRAGNKNKSGFYEFEIVGEELPFTTYELNPPSPTGENGWYTCDVEVTFKATGVYGIAYTKYRIDNGSWLTYTSPFTVDEEGLHTIYYYSVDNAGNVEEIKSFELKIDKTQPYILLQRPQPGYLYLFDRELFPLASGNTVIIGRITVRAIAYDYESGVSYVSFYLNGIPQSMDLIPPYEWMWRGIGFYYLHVEASDEAGLKRETAPIPVFII